MRHRPVCLAVTLVVTLGVLLGIDRAAVAQPSLASDAPSLDPARDPVAFRAALDAIMPPLLEDHLTPGSAVEPTFRERSIRYVPLARFSIASSPWSFSNHSHSA